MTISQKLILSFAFLLLTAAGAGSFGYYATGQWVAAVDRLKDQDAAFMRTAQETEILVLNLRRFEKDIFLNIGAREKQADYLKRLEAEGGRLASAIERLRGLAGICRDVDQEIRTSLDGLSTHFSAYMAGVAALARQAMDDPALTPQQANKLMLPIKDSTHNMEKIAGATGQYAQKRVERLAAAEAERAQATRGRLSAVLAACAVLAVLVAWAAARSVIRPIQQVTDFAAAVSEGDLEATVRGRHAGEMARLTAALERMLRRLKDMIAESLEAGRKAESQAEAARAALAQAEEAKGRAEAARKEGLMEAAARLEDVIGQINEGSDDLSRRIRDVLDDSSRQRERTQEAATAMSQMSESVLDVAQSASRAVESAESARSQAETGAQVVRDLVGSIAEVQDRAQGMSVSIADLGRHADSIGRIINVIQDIADQTNLLALNAAIEAARAGESGRGFAVVADEVRKLAEKTMSATHEVGQAVAVIQDGTKRNIAAMEQAMQAVHASTGHASRAGESLDAIVGTVVNATDQIRSIAAAAEEQSSASEEINRSTGEVSSLSGVMANNMSQAGTVMQRLAGLTVSLGRLTSQLGDG
ncbi:methyl-accepting chemotaxis protein [Desulfovibrio aminophilus]|nr:methyl-accepting chemotaxis protein [Desulfovibrio aminophilus]MCM0754035.1 methyl-accepting chemotaxis protein [Desulfovibrio aminophilus]